MRLVILKVMGHEISFSNSDTNALFPLDWHSNMNYKKKSEILSEAIEKKIPLIETDGYQDIIEGVKRNPK